MTTPSTRERRTTNALAWDFATSPRFVGLCVLGLLFASSAGTLAPQSVPGPLPRFLGLVTLASSLLLALRLAYGVTDWSRAHRNELQAVGWLHELPLPFFRAELLDERRKAFDSATRAPRRLVELLLAGVVLVAVTLPAAAIVARYLQVPQHGTTTLRPGATAESMQVEQGTSTVERRLDIQLSLLGVDESSGERVATVRVRDPRDGQSVDLDVSPADRIRVDRYYISLAGISRTPEPIGAVIRIGEGEDAIDLSLRAETAYQLDDGTEVSVRQVSNSYLGRLGPAAWIFIVGPDGDVVRNGWVYLDGERFETDHNSEPHVRLLALIPNSAATIAVSERGRFALSAPWFFAGWFLALASLLSTLALVRPRVVGRDGDWRLVVVGPMPKRWARWRGMTWTAEFFGKDAAHEWDELLTRLHGESI